MGSCASVCFIHWPVGHNSRLTLGSATASWSGSPSHPIHLTSALSFSFPLSFFHLPHQAKLSSSLPLANRPTLPFSSKASSPLHQSQWPLPVFSPLAWPPPWPRSLALPCVSTLPTPPSVPSLVRDLPHLELIVAQPVDLKRHRPEPLRGQLTLNGYD